MTKPELKQFAKWFKEKHPDKLLALHPNYIQQWRKELKETPKEAPTNQTTLTL